ncbi:MAG: histidine phosphatase family protein [Candidimonas sp.]
MGDMVIYLVRHGESVANIDKNIYLTVADHDISLSSNGKLQAIDAGKSLNGLLLENGHKRVRIWNSPYRRARQTARLIADQLHRRFDLDFRESNRLCEQQYGLFDGIPDNERSKHFPNEAAHYEKCENHNGHYWARMPLGESRFDVSNRLHQTFGTFHRDYEKHGIDTIVVVCHGVTLRAFVQEWLHLSPEWFNCEPNPGNCQIRRLRQDRFGWHDDNYVHGGRRIGRHSCDHIWPKIVEDKSMTFCSSCYMSMDEYECWDTMPTQQRSRILVDLTLRGDY